MHIEIKSVNHHNMKDFLSVPASVYGRKNIPNSVNNITTGLRFIPLANPVLQHVRFANFVAMEEGKPVGRITASVDNLNPRTGEGFFGCFECVNRPATATALINAAAKWLRSHGKTVMTGPATLNTNQQVGILIEGFEHEIQDEIPYNPPYYKNLLEESGLAKYEDLECYNWKLPEILPPRLERLAHNPGIVIRSINYRQLTKEARIIKEINNRAMSEIWGFIPMTLDDVYGFLLNLSSIMPAKLFTIVEFEKRPAAMLIGIPYRKPRRGKSGKIRIAIGGIVPELRTKGLHLHGLRQLYITCKELGYTEGEISQVAESNQVVKRAIIKPILKGEIIKRYRVYRKELI